MQLILCDFWCVFLPDFHIGNCCLLLLLLLHIRDFIDIECIDFLSSAIEQCTHYVYLSILIHMTCNMPETENSTIAKKIKIHTKIC